MPTTGVAAMQRAERYVRSAVERELEAVRGTVSGRNCALNRAVFAVATLMHTGAVSRSEIETRFLEAALALGLSRPEARATIKSALDAGLRNPRGMLGTGSDVHLSRPAESKAAPKGDESRKSERVQATWMSSQPAPRSLVECYLQGARSIPMAVPQSLRFHPRLWHSETRQHLPAMVGAVVQHGGGMTGVTITYLRDDGGDKADVDPERRMLGAVKGSGVWLSHEQEPGCIVVAEGIETALSVQACTGTPAVAALSAYFLPDLMLPCSASRVIIAADTGATGENGRTRPPSAGAGRDAR